MRVEKIKREWKSLDSILALMMVLDTGNAKNGKSKALFVPFYSLLAKCFKNIDFKIELFMLGEG